MTSNTRRKLRQQLTFRGDQFERGDGSSLDHLLRALDTIDQLEKDLRDYQNDLEMMKLERDVYRRALENITKVADKHSVQEMIRVVVEAHDALTQGDALRDTRDLARADGGSGQSGAGAPTTPPHKSSERTSLIDDPTVTRQAGERPAD